MISFKSFVLETQDKFKLEKNVKIIDVLCTCVWNAYVLIVLMYL